MAFGIREPVAPADIQAELGARSLVRSFRGIEIHCVTAEEAPSVMQEIGRIREVEFRHEGGGTGKAVDIDEFDTGPDAFRQLVAWDPDNGELIGMYRMSGLGRLTHADGIVRSPAARLFEMSQRFVSEFAPHTVELGRSVVNRSARRALMGLFCVWAGLGAVVAERPDVRYFFGKVTSYRKMDTLARQSMYEFLETTCPDLDMLVRPRAEYAEKLPSEETAGNGTSRFARVDQKTALARLLKAFRDRNEQIPPLLISYLELSSTMRSFGTARNPVFGDVLETAILVTIADINERQRARFIESYISENPSAIAL